jgi:tetratricopeptide (TPR) repeat protein
MSGGIGIKYQNPRDFTVKICNRVTKDVVGTGIAISRDGKVITCGHVVHAAGVNILTGLEIQSLPALIWEGIVKLLRKEVQTSKAQKGEVLVYLPGVSQERRAHLIASFPDHHDDIVMLQLIDGTIPLEDEQFPVLGSAKESQRDAKFITYGYRRLAKYQGLAGGGEIVSAIERPAEYNLHAEPIQLRSKEIDRGMSGAAVLDLNRNLVVGVISETADLQKPWRKVNFADRDTSIAVDAIVLELSPFNLSIADKPQPLRPGPQLKFDLRQAESAAASEPGDFLEGAPSHLSEWTGRAELLRTLDSAWTGTEVRVSGLIGFGGEGKSSVAREWLNHLRASSTLQQPDGVFWWGFYDKPSVDTFFEIALDHFAGDRFDPRKISSAGVRAQVIGAMLAARRYLFILDGLEVLQYQQGDQYGSVTSSALREFLELFASSDHRSFCLITSRVPLIELLPYKTYAALQLDRLTAEEGRILLSKVGVKGDEEALEHVVEQWDGHALTLSLLGGYLVRRGGYVSGNEDIPTPLADEPRFEGVRRVLRQYDRELTAVERNFLQVLSAFRIDVESTAITPSLFTANATGSALNSGSSVLVDPDLSAIFRRLVQYRILRAADADDRVYSLHPLIRDYYYSSLGQDRVQLEQVHRRIMNYYITAARNKPYSEFPSLTDLYLWIEAVYHACRAGFYGDAYKMLRDQVYCGNREVITHQLGAFETLLMLLREFFPEQDVSREPLSQALTHAYFITNEMGVTLIVVGRLREALPFHQRAVAYAQAGEFWADASRTCENWANLYAHLGSLEEGAEKARTAERFANKAIEARISDSDQQLRNAWGVLAWIAYLGGDLVQAGKYFGQLKKMFRNAGYKTVVFLYAVRYAYFLRRRDQTAEARSVILENLKICREGRFLPLVAVTLSALGDLDASKRQWESSAKSHTEAVSLARNAGRRDFLIETLLAQGRSAVLWGDLESAQDSLQEALDYSLRGSFQLYEADVRIALAWRAKATMNTAKARAHAERAKEMSIQMGYYWAQTEAERVLAAL